MLHAVLVSHWFFTSSDVFGKQDGPCGQKEIPDENVIMYQFIEPVDPTFRIPFATPVVLLL